MEKKNAERLAQATEARERRAERLATTPEPQPAPPCEPTQLPTLEDDLLSQALSLGPEQFSVPLLCLAARTARSPRRFAMKMAQTRLRSLGWQPEQLPTGLSAGLGTLTLLSSARLLEGLTVSVPSTDEARLCRLLQAFGAAVVSHTDQAADCKCSPMEWPWPASAPHGEGASSPPPPTISAAALEAFIFSPFVSTSQSFKTGHDLDDEQILEVLEGYPYECALRPPIFACRNRQSICKQLLSQFCDASLRAAQPSTTFVGGLQANRMERCTGKISPCVRIAMSALGMSSTSGTRQARNAPACSVDSLLDLGTS